MSDLRRAVRLVLAFALPFVLFGGVVFAAGPAAPIVRRAAAFAVTRPVAELARESIVERRLDKDGDLVTEEEEEEGINPTNTERVKPSVFDPRAVSFDPTLAASRLPIVRVIPAPSITFDGVNSTSGILPPDTVGAVGPNHYVQNTNSSTSAITAIGIYNKTGTLLVPIFSMATLFTSLGAGNACAANDDGDPIVLYDSFADRWLISQFVTGTSPTRQCVAISQTGDPTGAYFAYEFVMPNAKLNDYPHFGVWHDAYYMTDNQFLGNAFAGGGIFAFDRAKMVAGDPTAAYVYFDVATIDPSAGGFLPTQADGVVPPPATLPQLVMEFRADEFGDPADALRFYEFVPNFVTPASSTLTVRPDLVLASFDARSPNTRAIAEQPAPGVSLDTISDRLMFRLQYRNLGTLAAPQNRWTGNFTVNTSGVNPTTAATFQAGIRWFILQSTGSSLPTVLDQGTHSPDAGNGAAGANRWMASAALDHLGNLGVGFSRSSTTLRPDILIAGRLAGDPAGSLTQGEAVFFASGGVQTSSSSRWGDYSAMTVDPVDDCTFWYTQEYYAANAGSSWRTRIGSFVFPGCTPPQKGTVAVNVTNCSGGAPIQGATVKMTGGFVQSTDASGNLVSSFIAGPDSYTVTANKAGWLSGPLATAPAVVTNGGTTNVSVCLTGVASGQAGAATIVTESCTPANNALDPGETVTVSLCVLNNGTANTVNLVGTLQATGGVTGPSGPQNYGAVVAGGAAVCRNFTFAVDGSLACGGSVTASLQLQDGASNLGTVTYNFVTGTLTGPVVSNTFSYTGPAVAIPDNNGAGVNVPLLVSGLPVPSAITDLNFTFDTGGACTANTGDVNAGLDHTFVGDIVVALSAPGGGPSVALIDRIGVPASTFGNSTNNFCAVLLDDDGGFPSIEGFASTTLPVSGSFAPNNPLSGFDGFGSPNGTWNLNVSDLAAQDTGSVRRFSLVIQTTGRVCSTACVVPCGITCPAGFSVDTTPGQCSAPINFPAPTTTGACGAVTCDPPSGTTESLGGTTVFCTAAGGPSCSFTVIVVDNEPPTVTPTTCPPIEVPGQGGDPVPFIPPAAFDNCAGILNGQCTPAPGSVFPSGTTNVTCLFGGPGTGGISTCNFPLTVRGSVVDIPTLSPEGFGGLAGLLGLAALVTLLRRRRRA
ncbi:MAG TPA: hypothetical protein VN783_14635 [Thermoanaerobaculia bacterium]|nr:hypothetical protein [Thermoanaerobaculia bacterium]